MKKLLAFLLAALLVLSLAACGGETAENPYAKYEELFQYLETEDYDSAAAYIRDLAGTGEDAPATEETEAPTEVTEPSYTTVEITLDNWQDFFEFKVEPRESRNSFDELTDLDVYLFFGLKEEWADVVKDMDVAVGASCTGGYYCWYTYNL